MDEPLKNGFLSHAPKWGPHPASAERHSRLSKVYDTATGPDRIPAECPLRDLTLAPLASTSDISRPPAGARLHLHLGVLGRLALTISTAAIVAFVATGRLPPLPNMIGSAHRVMAGRTSSTTEWPQGPAPRLAVMQAVLSTTDEDLPLGMSVLGASGGAALVINGLPTGSVLSSGSPVGTNGWAYRLRIWRIP